MEFNYKMSGTCATKLAFDLAPDGSVTRIRFAGGCNGNLKALSKVLDGWQAKEIIDRLAGNTCGFRTTSCADQLAIALKRALAEQKKEGAGK